MSTVPPGAHTYYNIRARISRHFVFSLDEDSCINCRKVGKFLMCFYVFIASGAWLKFGLSKFCRLRSTNIIGSLDLLEGDFQWISPQKW